MSYADDLDDCETSQERWDREQAGPAPSFCAVCTRTRKGLIPQQRPGRDGRMRWTFVCLDCEGMGALADLQQHDVAERGGGSARTSRRGGAR